LARLQKVYEHLGSVDRVERPVAVRTALATTGVDREIVNLSEHRHGPLAVAETLGSLHGELRSLKGQALFGGALLFGKALLVRSPLPVRRPGNSSIPPRWWPVSDRFLVR
jgi:hypothetical protein